MLRRIRGAARRRQGGRGAFSRGAVADALCGPCDAASANAARLAEDPEARPIACTLEPRECFKTQQYTCFAAWMFLCYAGFAAAHVAAKAGAARLSAWADAADDAARAKRAIRTDADTTAGERAAIDSAKEEKEAWTFASARASFARLDPFGPRFLNFRDPSETWTALIAATLNFSRTAEIVRTVGLMFAYRKVGWWVVSAASAFRRHRRWM